MTNLCPRWDKDSSPRQRTSSGGFRGIKWSETCAAGRELSPKLKFEFQPRRLTSLVRSLLDWFRQNARDLPWRRTRDPYAVWISEIMLQQTQVKTVIPYWERWMRELPTIRSLAKSKPERVLKLWEGLGYYTRVRNLQRASQRIVVQHGGTFPKNYDDVLALPGVGRYTAGAICSIAFNQPTPVLDGNVTRILTRLFCIGSDPKQTTTNAQLWKLAEMLVTGAAAMENKSQHSTSHSHPCANCSHLNQALMELGAVICTPRQPKCAICPLLSQCAARRAGCAESLPRAGKRVATQAQHWVAFVVEHRGRWLARQRPGDGVNAHLWEFPNLESNRSGVARKQIFRRLLDAAPGSFEPLCTVKHSITRYRITLEAIRVKLDTPPRKTDLFSRWLPLNELRKLPFTSAHRRVLEALTVLQSQKFKARGTLWKASLPT